MIDETLFCGIAESLEHSFLFVADGPVSFSECLDSVDYKKRNILSFQHSSQKKLLDHIKLAFEVKDKLITTGKANRGKSVSEEGVNDVVYFVKLDNFEKKVSLSLFLLWRKALLQTLLSYQR